MTEVIIFAVIAGFLGFIALKMGVFKSSPKRAEPGDPADADDWLLEPGGKAMQHSDGVSFDPTEVNYATVVNGPLDDASVIEMDYFVASEAPILAKGSDSPGLLCLYFQRFGDDWSGRGEMEHYRWFAFPPRAPLTPGKHTVSLALTGDKWKSIGSSKGSEVPGEFQEALVNAERVGFVLGGGNHAGHGVTCAGPARIKITRFEVR